MSSAAHDLIRCTEHGDVLVVTVAAEQLTALDAVDRIEVALRGLVDSRPQRRWVIDFGEVTFIVTPVINTLLSITKRLRSDGGELVLTGLNSDIRHIFEMMRLDEVLTITEDQASALRAARPS